MPRFDLVKSVEVVRSPRVLQLEGIFDIPPNQRSEEHWTIDFPYDEQPWSVGLIVGPSGSGKTTLAREAFGPQLVSGYDWPADYSLVDAFPAELGIKEITGLLSSVGFSSPPAWLRPFACLSNGEQFRATIARALADSPDLCVVDEFTSVVDRTVAQIGSAAVAKAVRRAGKRFVAVTCHYDVIDWLAPDWVLEMPLGEFTRRSLRGRPNIELEIIRCHRAAWGLFKRHHYLSRDLNPTAKCFVALIHGRPAAFASAMAFPHATRSGWREHRTVCLPDFQGVGIGNALSEFVASLFAATKRPYFSTTSNPAMIRHRAKSPLWHMNRSPSRTSGGGDNGRGSPLRRSRAVNRLTAGFEYVGPARPDEAKSFGVIR
jgi:energy-coupling factor transporter ATP-binding protein EcfA2